MAAIAQPRSKPAQAQKPGHAKTAATKSAPAKTAVGTAPRRDPHRRILDAAISCFTRMGFHGASMQEICAAAEMSPGALYRYFPSKESIIIAIVEEERAARASLLAHLENAPTFVEGLIAMGRCLFSGEMPMVCVGLGPEIASEATRNPTLKAKFDEVDNEMTEAIRVCFEAARARGEIDPSVDTEVALLMIGAIGDGLLLRHQLDPAIPLGDMMPVIGDMIGRMIAPKNSVPDRQS